MNFFDSHCHFNDEKFETDFYTSIGSFGDSTE